MQRGVVYISILELEDRKCTSENDTLEKGTSMPENIETLQLVHQTSNTSLLYYYYNDSMLGIPVIYPGSMLKPALDIILVHGIRGHPQNLDRTHF
jgi:hypothetical protein